jgi:uncharacterized phiE125 gp8 family phage protein
MSARLVTGPTTEPVTLAQAKAALLYDRDDQDVFLSTLIASARERCEQFTGRAFGVQTWELGTEARPLVEVPYPPLVSITSVTAYPLAVAAPAVVLPTTTYTVDDFSTPGRVMFDLAAVQAAAGALRPVVPIVILYEAGTDTSPYSIQQAVLELVRDGWIRETNQSGLIGSMTTQLPPRVTDLLYPWVVWYPPSYGGWGGAWSAVPRDCA